MNPEPSVDPANDSAAVRASLVLRPFYDRPWKGDQRGAAHALWHWHDALREATVPGREEAVVEAVAAVEAGTPVAFLPDSICQAAYAACDRHDLPRRLLASQVRAAAAMQPPVRFGESTDLRFFADEWAGSHGHLLARLGGLTLRSQLQAAGELAYGFFLVRRLVTLPHDIGEDLLFVPMVDVAQAGLSPYDLMSGPPQKASYKLMWKWSVRARDALAQGRTLARDLDPRPRRALRHAWYTALELLRVIEKRNFDVWSQPVELTATSRLAVQLQTWFGRASF